MIESTIRDIVKEELDVAVKKILAEFRRRREPASQKLLTTVEAAELARVSVDTIRRWIREGHLTSRGGARRHLIDRRELRAFLAAESDPVKAAVASGLRLLNLEE